MLSECNLWSVQIQCLWCLVIEPSVGALKMHTYFCFHDQWWYMKVLIKSLYSSWMRLKYPKILFIFFNSFLSKNGEICNFEREITKDVPCKFSYFSSWTCCAAEFCPILSHMFFNYVNSEEHNIVESDMINYAIWL